MYLKAEKLFYKEELFEIADIDPDDIKRTERWKVMKEIENKRYISHGYENSLDEVILLVDRIFE